MSGFDASAVEAALALYRAPHLSADIRTHALPDGMLWVVRTAAGDSQALEVLATHYTESPQVLVEACGFYVQQVMFSADADAYRVLGVRPDDASAVIREHHRWLIRWLHPDRIGEDWLGLFADRVNHAWHQLRNPDRRRQYDADRAAGLPPQPGFVPPPRAPRISGRHPLLGAVPHAQSRARWVAAGALLLGAVAIVFAWRHAEQAPAYSDLPLGLEQDVQFKPAYVRDIEARRSGQAARAQHMDSVRLPSDVDGGVPDELPALPASVGAGVPAEPVAASTPAPDTRLDALDDIESPRPARSEVVEVAAAPAEPPPDSATARTDMVPEPVAPGPAAPAPRPRTPDAVVGVVVEAATPVQADPVPAPAPDPQPTLDRTAVLAFLGHFQVAYERGELAEFMDLFAADARNNRGGRDAIREDYDMLFASTRSRQIHFEDLQWTDAERGGELRGTFLARVEPLQGRRRSETRGEIRFGLVLEDGEPRIASVRHSVRD